jgi:polar amino acid transport system substrate-binding protein
MTMKNSVLRLAAAGFLIALTSCSPAPTGDPDAIRIGIASEPYPPFSVKGPDGQWSGWEIEIGDAVCAAMNEPCEFIEISWDGLIPALTSRRIDVIMASLSITEERLRTIDFSNKYYESPSVLVAPRVSEISADPSSLEGMTLGVQRSTIHANYIEAYFDDAIDSMKTYPNFVQHNQDLVAGRVDAVVGDSVAMQPFLQSTAGQCCEVKAELHDPEIFGLGAGFGMRKGEADLKSKLDAAIEAIRSDGTYEAISAPYFDFDIFGGA